MGHRTPTRPAVTHFPVRYVSIGGVVKRVLPASGGSRGALSKYLATGKNVGFDVLELSSRFLSIPTNDCTSLVEFTAKHGLKPKPEVVTQWGAGGEASVKELESAGSRDSK